MGVREVARGGGAEDIGWEGMRVCRDWDGVFQDIFVCAHTVYTPPLNIEHRWRGSPKSHTL